MTIASCNRLRRGTSWDRMPFDRTGGGCGGSMRTHPLGLQLHGASRRHWLVALGIEAGRVTHSHPTGFLGSLTAAVFTAYAMEEVPVPEWGWRFMGEVLPMAKQYLKSSRCVGAPDLQRA